MKLSTFLLPALALLATLGVPAAAQEQDAATHRQAVTQMVDTTRLADAMLVSIKEMGDTPGPSAELLKHMHAHASRNELIELYVPIFAPLVTTESAREVAQAFASADGRKVAETMVAKSRRNAGPAVKLSPADQKLHARFGSTPAYKQFMSLHLQTKAARDKAIREWISAYHTGLYKNAYDAMEAHFHAFDQQGSEPPAAYVPAPVGLADVDAWIGRLAKISSRNVAAEWQFQKDMEKMGVKKLLTPHSLTSPQVVVNNHTIMEVLRSHNEAYLLELELALQEYAASAVTVAPAGSERAAQVQKEVDDEFKYNARFAKNNRAMLETIGRILQFARDRKGRLSVHDGSLVLGKEDHAVYTAYAAQFQREMEESEKLTASRTRRKSNLF